MNGLLVLVVGPSGSGKDTLLAGAAASLRDDPNFVFARRVVTRAAAHEDHDTATVADFMARQASGDLAITWSAHDLHYGIPAAPLSGLEKGHVVVANVSRSVVPRAEARYPTKTVEITAPDAMRAARLEQRGRETTPAISARLTRQVSLDSKNVHRIVNDKTIDAGVTALVDLLLSFRLLLPQH